MWFAPDFDYWRQFETLTVHEIAALMRGVDPREAHEVLVRSTDPKNEIGDPLDLADQIRIVVSALEAGSLQAAHGDEARASSDSQVRVVDLVDWLKHRNRLDLALALDSGSAIDEPTRRLRTLRQLGGDVTSHAGGRWTCRGIGALKAKEVSERRPRTDEKTLRKDLISAAQKERDDLRQGQAQVDPSRISRRVP